MTTDEILCEKQKHPIREEIYRTLEFCYNHLPEDGLSYVDDECDGKEKWNEEYIKEIERYALVLFSCGCELPSSKRHRHREPTPTDDIIPNKLFFILQKCPEHRVIGEEDWPDDDSYSFGNRNWARKFRERTITACVEEEYHS